jgi:homoserine dehydrogenase
MMPDAELSGRAYLRLRARDEPGVLSQIAGVMGEEGVGIAQVVQRPDEDGVGTVPVIVLTHRTNEAALGRAIAKIQALTEVTETVRLIRIEEEF